MCRKHLPPQNLYCMESPLPPHPHCSPIGADLRVLFSKPSYTSLPDLASWELSLRLKFPSRVSMFSSSVDEPVLQRAGQELLLKLANASLA